MNPFAALALALLLTASCTTVPEVRDGCGYDDLRSEEHRFVLPTLEEYATGEGERRFYVAPRRAAPLRLTTLRYRRDYAGRRYRLLGTVAGEDGRYRQWLTEDCRLLYTPEEER